MAAPARGAERLRIVVSGFLGLWRSGGVVWDYAQYVSGLAALGHDVWYVEDTGLWPVWEEAAPAGVSASPAIEHLGCVAELFGFGARWAYRDEVTGGWHGPAAAGLAEVVQSADVLLNVSAALALRDEYARIPVRALVDTDPMFTQIQMATATQFTDGRSSLPAAGGWHTHWFTYGENVGQPDCRMPACGLDWRPTRYPLDLTRWPARPRPTVDSLGYTTVMNWTAGRPLVYAGEEWGQKDREFPKVLPLPARCPRLRFGVVVGGGDGRGAPVDELRAAGFAVWEPRVIVGPADYQSFMARSAGELAPAKHTYVHSRSGWFSGRSACYLATGRPVVAQDTGWSRHLPHGEGLLAFADTEGAVEALREVEREPARHAAAARAVAEECFDARRVLGRLVADLA